jgi:hypothetical protein
MRSFGEWFNDFGKNDEEEQDIKSLESENWEGSTLEILKEHTRIIHEHYGEPVPDFARKESRDKKDWDEEVSYFKATGEGTSRADCSPVTIIGIGFNNQPKSVLAALAQFYPNPKARLIMCYADLKYPQDCFAYSPVRWLNCFNYLPEEVLNIESNEGQVSKLKEMIENGWECYE